MDDPAATLRAHLDEDERIARLRWNADGATSERFHGTPYDPVRVLDGIAAMRKVLDCWPDPTGAWTAEQADAARAMKRQILELLAAPYAPTEEE